VALWTCRYAWTTRSALPTCPQHSNSSRKTSPSNRDSRLTTRLRRCQKPDSQNASRPGRHQIGMVGEIISESWARSNRYTRARSSESAGEARFHRALVLFGARQDVEEELRVDIDTDRGRSRLVGTYQRSLSPNCNTRHFWLCWRNIAIEEHRQSTSFLGLTRLLTRIKGSGADAQSLTPRTRFDGLCGKYVRECEEHSWMQDRADPPLGTGRSRRP
jgi:hypothetical protein